MSILNMPLLVDIMSDIAASALPDRTAAGDLPTLVAVPALGRRCWRPAREMVPRSGLMFLFIIGFSYLVIPSDRCFDHLINWLLDFLGD
jgi:hypothetical protein